MADKQQRERISRFQQLEKPEFKSAIPPHLVNKLSEQEKYVIETVSRMEAQNEWLIQSAMHQNRALIENDLEIQEIKDWKSMITSKGAVIIALILMFLPMLLKALVDRLLKP